MKHFYHNDGQQWLTNSSYIRAKKLNRTEALSDRAIFLLQDYFLTPGFHLVTTSTFQVARELLASFLASMNYHSNVGLISCEGAEFNHHYTDLYRKFTQIQVATEASCSIEEFLLSSFSFDFLAIECTSDLLQEPWFIKLEQLLIEYNISKSIPIIMFFTRRTRIKRRPVL